jgi:hypothetical protein
MDTTWLNAWSNFVLGNGDLPGLVSNKGLTDENGKPLPKLKSRVDYRGVTPLVYYIFCGLHGWDKSRPICRYTVDIYSKEFPEELLVDMVYTAKVCNVTTA